MPAFHVATPARSYDVIVENGLARRVAAYLPVGCGKIFVVSTNDVFHHVGAAMREALREVPHELLILPGGEASKRLAPLESVAEQMIELGADRTSVVLAFGGGIVTDMAGFLAAIFMRGIPVIQIPTTLLAQVDAAIGGKTGVNLESGKNLIGSFHQPLAVLVDPELLATLPPREFRAGLFEVIKSGVIASPTLFDLLEQQRDAVLRRDRDTLEWIIAECVRIKAEVVSADEREMGLRKTLNFGHTVGHALEAETGYNRFLHGEAVAFGMIAATHLAQLTDHAPAPVAARIEALVHAYGPIPDRNGLDPASLQRRLLSDKKTLRGHVHFVLPTAIGATKIVKDVDPALVHQAIEYALG
jgi:3-dehydroquinate synthase